MHSIEDRSLKHRGCPLGLSGLSGRLFSVWLAVVLLACVFPPILVADSEEDFQKMAKLAEIISRNRVAIRTWEGSFKVINRTGNFRPQPMDGIHFEGELVKEGVTQVDFKLDLVGNRLWVSYKPDGPSKAITSSGKSTVLKSVRGVSQISLLTSDEYFYVGPHSYQGPLKSQTEGVGPQSGKVIVRESATAGKRFEQTHVFNPSTMVYFTKGVTVDGWFSKLAKSKESTRPLKAAIALPDGTMTSERLTVSGAIDESETIVVRFITGSGTPEQPYGLQEFVLRQDHSYMPVSMTKSVNLATWRVWQKIEWDYARQVDALVPVRYSDIRFDTKAQAGKDAILHSREVQAVSFKINEELSKDAFRLESLGMKNGDRLQDLLDGHDGVYLEGEILDFADYDAKTKVISK